MLLRLLPAALLAFATLLGAGSPARAQGPIDERFLSAVESADNIFPTIDYRTYA